jgi:hypothetical protein
MRATALKISGWEKGGYNPPEDCKKLAGSYAKG